MYGEVDKDSVVDACNSIERRLQELLVYDPSLEGVVQCPSGGSCKMGRFYCHPRFIRVYMKLSKNRLYLPVPLSQSIFRNI